MCIGQRAKLTIAPHAGYSSKGKGIVPPNAELIFDVELLDINFAVTLARYRATLDAWVATKLEAFDGDEIARAPLETKHGSRAQYETYLQGVAHNKYQAERVKRFASAGIDAPAVVDDAVAAVCNGVGAAKIAGGAAEPQGAVSEAPPRSLQFSSRFANFKVEPNDESEGRSPNFPRSLHNAAEMFVHLGHAESAATLHACVTRCLELLEGGPDGKSAQRIGRACVCWGCGHVGLPKNSAQCSEKAATPAGVCAKCACDGQTNFVKLVVERSTVPWIEANVLSADEAANVARAANAAEVAEVS